MKKKTEIISKKKTKPVSAKEYAQIIVALKKQVEEDQMKTVLSANQELITFYWEIGRTIFMKQKESGWDSNIIGKLALDLQISSSEIAGFSRANIFKMRAFYQAYEKVSPAVRQIKVLHLLDDNIISK